MTNQLFELKKELTKSDDRATWQVVVLLFILQVFQINSFNFHINTYTLFKANVDFIYVQINRQSILSSQLKI